MYIFFNASSNSLLLKMIKFEYLGPYLSYVNIRAYRYGTIVWTRASLA